MKNADSREPGRKAISTSAIMKYTGSERMI